MKHQKTGMVLKVEATDIFSLLIFFDCCDSVTTSSTRRYLETTVVQLLQDDTAMRANARGFAVSS